MIFLGGILGTISSDLIEIFGQDEVFNIRVKRGTDLTPLAKYSCQEIALPVIFLGDQIFLVSTDLRLMSAP